MKRVVATCAWILCFVGSAQTFGQCPPQSCLTAIRIDLTAGGNTVHAGSYCSGCPITITVNPDLERIRVYINDANEFTLDDFNNYDIGTITLAYTLDGNGQPITPQVDILVTPDGEPGQDPPTPGGRHWTGIVGSPNVVGVLRNTTLTGRIVGNLSGVLTVSRIELLRVAGAVQAIVTAGADSADPASHIELLRVGSIAEGAVIQAIGQDPLPPNLGGDIKEVEVNPGNLSGNVLAPKGEIRRIDVISGDIGAPSQQPLPQISARVDASTGETFELIKAHNIYANISACPNVNCPSVVSEMVRIEALGSPGVFAGSLNVSYIDWKESDPVPGIYVAGDLEADLNFSSGVSAPIEIGGDLTADASITMQGVLRTSTPGAPEGDGSIRLGRIVIGGNLFGDISIGQTFAAGALDGFVTINGDNNGSIWDDDNIGTDAEVTVKSTSGFAPLAPTPFYSQPSATLTNTNYGGEAGLVPYNLKRVDCDPPEPTPTPVMVVPTPGAQYGANRPILMRHYGPVTWNTANGSPYIIIRKKAGTSEEVDVSTSCFTQALDPNNPSVVRLTPVDGNFLTTGNTYTVSRRTYFNSSTGQTENVLRCAIPDDEAPPDFANQPEVFDYDPVVYIICSDTNQAIGDSNSDGAVNFADLTDTLSNFNAASLCYSHGDANRDGVVTFADVAAVLANFNSTPCNMQGQSFVGGSGDGFSTMRLEGETVASSFGNISEALASMGYASIDNFTDAIAAMSEEERNEEVRRLGALLGAE